MKNLFKKIVKISMIGASLFAINTTVSAHGLSPFKATFDAGVGITLGQITFNLEDKGNNCYAYQSDAKPTGIASWIKSETVLERSEFCVRNNQIQPDKYIYRHTGNKKKAEKENVVLDFDWAKKTVIDDQNNKRDLPANALDRLVIQMQMRKLLFDNKDKLPTGIIPMTMVEKDRVVEYQLKVIGKEKLKTALGELDTIRLDRVDDPRKSTRFWLAVKYDFLPVRVEQQKGDESIIFIKIRTLGQ